MSGITVSTPLQPVLVFILAHVGKKRLWQDSTAYQSFQLGHRPFDKRRSMQGPRSRSEVGGPGDRSI